MTEQSRGIDLIKRLFVAVEDRDLDAMFEIYAEDAVIREAASLPYGGEYTGHSGVTDHGVGYVNAWTPRQIESDQRLDPEFLDCGDQVVVRWTQRAHAATGQPLEWPALSLLYRIQDGRIVEAQMFLSDTAAIVRMFQSRDESQPAGDGPRGSREALQSAREASSLPRKVFDERLRR